MDIVKNLVTPSFPPSPPFPPLIISTRRLTYSAQTWKNQPSLPPITPAISTTNYIQSPKYSVDVDKIYSQTYTTFRDPKLLCKCLLYGTFLFYYCPVLSLVTVKWKNSNSNRMQNNFGSKIKKYLMRLPPLHFRELNLYTKNLDLLL